MQVTQKKNLTEIISSVTKYINTNYEEELLDAPLEATLFGISVDNKSYDDSNVQYSYSSVPLGLRNLDKLLDLTWSETIFYYIDKKNIKKDSEVYKKSYISRQTFSKIRANKYYQPNKDTSMQICIGLKLNLDEAFDLMGKAGYVFSKSLKRDLVFMYYIENHIYDIAEINDVLYELNMEVIEVPE